MNSRKITLIMTLIIAGIILTSCNQNDELDYNKNLKENMSRKEVVELLGEPIKDIGSGVAIYIYPIDETKKLMLIFNGKDKLVHMNYVYNDGTEESIF